MSNGFEESSAGESRGLPPSTASPHQPPGRLPQPPQVGREIKFGKPQLFGVPFLLLIPVLALTGVLGDSSKQARAEDAQLSVEVTHPSVIRFRNQSSMEVAVMNRGSAPIETVTVVFDKDWLGKFVNVAFVPEASHPATVELTELLPGERREISVELAPQDYGTLRGAVHTELPNGSGPQVKFETFVLP